MVVRKKPRKKQVLHSESGVIEYAGLGIAVANAEDALKEKADVVTISTNNEDAVSEAIERLLFN